MNSEQFWSILDRAASVSPISYRHTAALITDLEQLSPGELLEFEDHFNSFFNQACTPGLWDVATIILGECSEPKFEQFRGWLIKRGRSAFETGIANPNELALFVNDTAECLRTLGLAQEIYAKKTGAAFVPKVARAPDTIETLRTPREELPARYPKVSKAFPYLESALKRMAAAKAAPPPVTVTAQMLKGPKLSRKEFWKLIDECRPKLKYLDEEKMVAELQRRLVEMPLSGIVSFQRHVEKLIADSHSDELRKVADSVLDGCSDDSFDYVCGWLIGMGKEVYTHVLADPERIVDYFAEGDEPGCQTILTVGHKTFSQRTNGAAMPGGE